MKRTHDQYQSLDKPAEQSDTFDFAAWSDTRLTERLSDCMESQLVPHGELRRTAIAREINHLIFERAWRLQNG